MLEWSATRHGSRPTGGIHGRLVRRSNRPNHTPAAAWSQSLAGRRHRRQPGAKLRNSWPGMHVGVRADRQGRSVQELVLAALMVPLAMVVHDVLAHEQRWLTRGARRGTLIGLMSCQLSVIGWWSWLGSHSRAASRLTSESSSGCASDSGRRPSSCPVRTSPT